MGYVHWPACTEYNGQPTEYVPQLGLHGQPTLVFDGLKEVVQSEGFRISTLDNPDQLLHIHPNLLVFRPEYC